MVNRDRRVQRRPRVAAQAFRNLPVMARAVGQLYKAGSRALQPREKARKTSKAKNAVSSMPKDRIGRNAGLIVSNQKVPRPKPGSVQYRRSVFGSVQQADKVWLGGSTIGDQPTLYKTIAHSILAHYLPKMGDMRASNVQDPEGIKVFTSFAVEYAKDAPASTVAIDYVLGSPIANDDYIAMATNLGSQMQAFARKGQYPMSIGFTLLDGGSILSVLRDQQMGRHHITMSIQGKFRFQNVTPGAAGDHSTNINSVDASPVNGKIYSFRNQAPLFAPPYMETQTAAIQGFSRELQRVATGFEIYGTTATGTAGGKGGQTFDHIPAPPLNPSSIWRNVSKTGTAVFPPGGFKTYNTSFLRSETIAKFCQAITQSDLVALPQTGASTSATYPPAGDSFMMCLRPTIKVLQGDGSTGEVVKMAYNIEYILKASIKRMKRSPLQVVNLIE